MWFRFVACVIFLLISADLEPQLAHSRHFNTSWISKWIQILPKRRYFGTSLVVQSLRLCTSTSGGAGSIPGRGTETPHPVHRALQQKKKKKCCFECKSNVLSARGEWRCTYITKSSKLIINIHCYDDNISCSCGIPNTYQGLSQHCAHIISFHSQVSPLRDHCLHRTTGCPRASSWWGDRVGSASPEHLPTPGQAPRAILLWRTCRPFLSQTMSRGFWLPESRENPQEAVSPCPLGPGREWNHS